MAPSAPIKPSSAPAVGGFLILETPLPAEYLIRLPELIRLIGLSKASIYRLEKADAAFPHRVRIGQRAVAWRASDVARWVETRSAPSAAD